MTATLVATPDPEPDDLADAVTKLQSDLGVPVIHVSANSAGGRRYLTVAERLAGADIPTAREQLLRRAEVLELTARNLRELADNLGPA